MTEHRWRQVNNIVFTVGVVLLIFLCAAIITACSPDPPDAGYVREHRYDDPDDRYVPAIHVPGACSSNGKTTTCSPGVYVPGYVDHDPERFLLVIDDGNETGEVQVDAETYHRVEDGDWFNAKTGLVELR